MSRLLALAALLGFSLTGLSPLALHAEEDDFGFSGEEPIAGHAESTPAPKLRALEARLEAGVVGRAFHYTDLLADERVDLANRRPADNVSPATPMLRLRVESFPLAALTRAWPARLGLHVDISGGLPTNVRAAPDEPSQGSQTQGQLLLGGQAQFHWAALEIVPRVAWGLHGWYLALDDGSTPPFPDLTYSFLELGVRLRGTVETLSLEGDLGVRPGLSAGGIESAEWFPNTTFYGVTTGASAGWNFHPAWALRLRVEFVQYGLTLNPEVGRPAERVAGGATDRSVSTSLGLEWRLGSAAR